VGLLRPEVTEQERCPGRLGGRRREGGGEAFQGGSRRARRRSNWIDGRVLQSAGSSKVMPTATEAASSADRVTSLGAVPPHPSKAPVKINDSVRMPPS
jgi:hypothetical protein